MLELQLLLLLLLLILLVLVLLPHRRQAEPSNRWQHSFDRFDASSSACRKFLLLQLELHCCCCCCCCIYEPSCRFVSSLHATNYAAAVAVVVAASHYVLPVNLAAILTVARYAIDAAG